MHSSWNRVAWSVAGIVLGYGVPSTHAATTIGGVSGTISADQRITITGSGFGQGPNVIFFDDFRSGTPGQIHQKAAVIGSWSSANGVVYSDPLLSKGKGMRIVDSPGAFISKVVFPRAASEVYTSFVGYVPDGQKYPGATAQEKLPTFSSLKMAWLMDGSDAYYKEGSDYVLGGHGGGLYRIASNDKGGPSNFDGSRDVGWRWDAPVRWAYWAKGNGTQRVGSDGLFQATNGREQVSTRYKDYKPWFRDADPDGAWEAHPNHTWDRINFAGYVNSGVSFANGENFVLSDIYIATGANAAARVEIGNAARYVDCTKLTFVTTGAPGDSWSDASITATIREGSFSDADLRNGYLYVTHADGSVNTVGFKLSAVPEPMSLGLIAIAGMLLRRSRRGA